MEYLLSAGIDIGTTTTHLVISRIGIAVERGWGTVPKAEIKEKTILYQSPIYFTPLVDGQIDLPRVQTIIHLELEQRPTGYERERLHRGVQHQPLRYGTGRSRRLYCRRDPRPAAKGRKVKTNKKRPVVCCGQQAFYLVSVSGGCGAL